MRALHLVALTAISLLSLSSQCGKEEPTPAPPPPAQPQNLPPQLPTTPPVPACVRTIAFAQVAGLYLPEPIPLADALKPKNYVIQSATAYSALFPLGTNPPAINFEDYTLLIGKIKINFTGSLASQQVVQTCTGRYTYTVKVQLGAGTAFMDMPYHVLVPKLPANAQVDFDVQVLPF